MTSSDQLAVLAAAQRNRLESFLMDFEANWNVDSLSDYCGQLESETSQVYRQLATAELVKIDLQRRWSSGQGQVLEDYFQEIPKLGTPESVDADLILAEYAARRSVDGKLKLESYASRFPKQFERLAQLVDSNLTDHSGSSSGQTPPVQASIETSRVGDVRDTSAPVQKPQEGIPQEFGRYRILRELGSGAMGVVYLAHDTQLDRRVALKTPSFGGGTDAQLVARFYREARAAAKIQHRNICPVYDVGEIDGRHFISMAFVKGRSMSEYITPDKLPPQKTSAILVHRIAMALADAHRHKVVHRDLKPANIIIDLKREPIVMDFGLARQTDVESRMTQSGMIVGTPAYMSPEQLKGTSEDLGPSVDIYSLGVILYELLTGKLPFRGAIAQVIYQIVSEKPTPPSQLRPGIDQQLETICDRMMAKDRGDRYQTMDEVAGALKDYVKGIKPRESTKVETEKRAGGTATSTGAAGSAIPSSKSKKPNSDGFSETGALNAFFAAQTDNNPEQTSSDSPSRGQSYPIAKRIPARKSDKEDVRCTDSNRNSVGAIPPSGGFKNTTEPLPQSQLLLSKKLNLESGFVGWINANRKWSAIGLGGAAVLMLMALGIFLIRTPYGTIRIETFGDLKGLEVVVDGDTVSLTESEKTGATNHEFALKLNGAELKLDPTTNEFVIAQNGAEHRLSVMIGELQLSSNQFTVMRNRETVLRIELLGDTKAVEDKPTPSLDLAIEKESPLSMTPIALDFAGTRERRSHGPRWLAFAPDGKTFASGGRDSTIRIWNSRINEVLGTLQGHEAKVKMIAYSPNGKQLASSSDDNTIRFWDVESRREIRQIDASSVNSIAYSAGGDTLAWAGSDGDIRLLDTATGDERQLINAHDAKTVSVAFSRDGQTLATASTDSTIKMWDVKNNYRHRATLRGHEKAVIYVTFSPDSKTLASTGVDKTIKLWDVETGKRKVSILTRSAWVFSTSFSPDGSTVAAGGVRRTIGLWNSQTGELLYETPQGKNNILVSTFSPDGKSIISSRTDFRIGVWNVVESAPDNVSTTGIRTGTAKTGRKETNRPLTNPTTGTDYDHLLTGKWFSLMDELRPEQPGSGSIVFFDDAFEQKNGWGAYFDTQRSRNAIFRAKVKKLQQKGVSHKPYLILRYPYPKNSQPPGKNYAYRTYIKGWNRVGIDMSSGGKWVVLAEKDIGRRLDEYFEWTLSVIDNQIKVYIDGKLVLSAEDSNSVKNGIPYLSGAFARMKDVEIMILDEPEPETASGGESWVELFNGRDLTGWKVVGGNRWKVKNGVLIGDGQRKDGGWLMSDKEYEDFELQLEYKLRTGGNSGVFFRAWPDGRKNGGDFHEIQLLDSTAPGYAHVDAVNRNGSLYGRIAAKPTLDLEPNRWHRMNISVHGDRLKVWINEEKILEGEIPAGKKEGGHVGLQLHQSDIEFRNIRIKKLIRGSSSMEPKTNSEPPLEALELPIGKWVPLLENEEQLKDWKIVNGGPTIVDGTVTLESPKKVGKPLYGKRLERVVKTDATRFIYHVVHNKTKGFGMAEGMVLGSKGIGVSHFGANKHELWVDKLVDTYRSREGEGNFANCDYVVIDGQWTAYLNGKKMFSAAVSKEPLTSIRFSVRRARGQWREIAVMRLSDSQVDAIARGELRKYVSGKKAPSIR